MREVRTMPLLEVRATTGDAPGLEGEAAVYNQWTELGNYYRFKEMIHPGFFSGCMADDVRALFNHDVNWVLGRTRKSKTLTLADTSKGLRFAVTLDEASTQHMEVHRAVARGDVDGCSFSFAVKSVEDGGQRWVEDEDGMSRELLPGGCERLYDVGPVTFPAYDQTSVAARGFVTARDIADSLCAAKTGDDLTACQRQVMLSVGIDLRALREGNPSLTPGDDSGSEESRATAEGKPLARRRRELDLLAIE